MKSMRSFTLALAGLVVTQASLFAASVLQEDFTTDPLAAGWRVFGDSRLFTWDAGVGHLQVTWDSRQTNSYFYRPLGTVLDKDDDFSFAFDLRLLELTPGINPAKANSPFQIAVGFIRLADRHGSGFPAGLGFSIAQSRRVQFLSRPGRRLAMGAVPHRRPMRSHRSQLVERRLRARGSIHERYVPRDDDLHSGHAGVDD